MKTSINWINKTILIADDECANYLLFEGILKHTNAKLIWAKNGQEALNICEHNDEIKLVLMDINMPVMNGFDSTRAIRKLKPNLPIIAQSANNLITVEMKEAGFNDFIQKPFKIIGLLNKIIKYVNV
ncbi:MAG: response regulator [Bacteroidales bacterium]